MSPNLWMADGRAALDAATDETRALAKSLERSDSAEAAAAVRERVARAIREELAQIRADLSAVAAGARSTTTSTSTSTTAGESTPGTPYPRRRA
jgi:hypothetical protein